MALEIRGVASVAVAAVGMGNVAVLVGMGESVGRSPSVDGAGDEGGRGLLWDVLVEMEDILHSYSGNTTAGDIGHNAAKHYGADTVVGVVDTVVGGVCVVDMM